MDSFDLYTQAFESSARDANGLFGEYLISSFVATEAESSFNLKATVQKYWGKLMELLDRFRRFIIEKFKAARAGGKKLLEMLKNRGGSDAADEKEEEIPSEIIDEATKMEDFVKQSDRLCKEAEELSRKTTQMASAQVAEMDDMDEALDELGSMVEEFLKKNQGIFDQFMAAGMDSNLSPGMEGIGAALRGARRFSNSIIYADAVMRAVEHLTSAFQQAAEACKRRFNGSNKNDAKVASRIQGIINRILGFFSKIGKAIASIPGRVAGLIRKARGNRPRVEKYDGPDPFAVG